LAEDRHRGGVPRQWGSRERGDLVSTHDAPEHDSYEDLLAQLESLAPGEAQSILTDLASAIFPSGSGNLRQVSWERDEVASHRSPGPGASAVDQRAFDEAKLRGAELRYRTLVEQIPAVTFMAVLGEGENEVYVSPHIEQLLGFTQKEWLENPFLWYTQLHSDDRPLWHAEFARGCRTGGPFRAECRFIARDGRIVWVRGEARLVKDELGRPLFLQGVAFDITESKQAQAIVVHEAVRTTEERYRDLVERLGAIFWEAEPITGAFTFVSQGAQAILGFPPERWLGEQDFWLTVVHPDDRSRAAAAWRLALDQGGDHEFEFRAITADHRLAWLNSRIHFPKTDRKNAKPVGVILDITDRKRAEEELARVLDAEQMAHREAEALNRVGRSLAAELDLDQLVKQITDVGMQLTGAEWAAFIRVADDGQPRDVYVRTPDGATETQPATVSPDDALLAATFEGATILLDDLGSHFEGLRQTRLPRELGLRSYLGVPVISRWGHVLGGIFCGHSRPRQFSKDHERIIEGFAVQTAIAVDNAQLYAAAEDARRTAEAANRAKDEFLATMSHELRTPLNAVLGWIQILQSGAASESNRARALATIERNARAQGQIINDLLDVSRIVTGKLHLTVEPVDLCGVVESALEAINLAAIAKQIRVSKQLDRTAAQIAGDADRLRQVVTNLLTNAVKFTPRGGRIDVRLDTADGMARIRIADSGQGIDPAFLPHVFDRFWQADSSTTRAHGGLGLGLAIVKHITEMHGGRVHAESAGKGLGATFSVEVPLMVHRAEVSAIGGTSQTREVADITVALNNASVLVVDDEADSRDLAVELFTSAGAKVTAAASVAEAMRALGRGGLDIVLCDIGMPEEDGFALIRQIRTLDGRRADVPVVAVTAYARDEDRQRALTSGFQAHVAKPFDARELLTVAAKLVAERSRS